MIAKRLMLITGVLIVLVFIGRLVYKVGDFSGSLEEERARYTSQLLYNFSSRVDSVKLSERGAGTVYCTITTGRAVSSAEDSLAKTLLHHTTLRFNESGTEGVLQFMMPGAERWQPGDSLVVNSELNALKFFRNGSEIYSDQLSNLLEGRVTKGL